jgi:nucleoside phosphorylase/tetratricopeptide (TPR) repeat protein
MQETIDVAILTPIGVEHISMCRQLADARELDALPWSTQIGRIGRHKVGVFLCGKGQEYTASAVALISHMFEPRWMFLTGIAGGIRKLRRGDVIVAEAVQALDYGKVEGGAFTRRSNYDWSADFTLLDRASRLAADPQQAWVQEITEARPDSAAAPVSRATVGYVGSSDKVVDDLNYGFIVDALKTAPEIDAFEMEASGAGAGVTLARAFRNVGILMIRGISDEPGQSEAPDAGSTQRGVWKPYAAHVAAVFTRLVIERIPRPAHTRRALRRTTPKRSAATKAQSAASLPSALLSLRAPAWILRRSLLDTVVRHVREGRFPVLLQGLPDVGKTSALAAAARIVAPEFQHVVALRCDPGAALEPIYVAESLNEFLATVGRDVPPEALHLQAPAGVFRQLVQRLVDLSLLVLIDDLQYLEPSLQQELVTGLAHGPGVRIIATTDRAVDILAHRVVIPPLEGDEVEFFVAEALRAYGIVIAVEEVLRRLPDDVRTQPAALLPLIAQLKDVPLDLWPLGQGAGNEPAHALESIIRELAAPARRALAIVTPLAGVQVGRALRYLSLVNDDGVRIGLPTLVDRSLVYRRDDAYVVPSVTSAAMRVVDPAQAETVLSELVDAWCRRAPQPVRTDDDAYACGEVAAALSVAGHGAGLWQLCRALASDEALERLNERGLWKEYTVVLRNGIDAAAREHRSDWVRLSCQLSRKLLELGEQPAAREVLDVAARDVRDGSTEHAWVLSHEAMFREQADPAGALSDLTRSLAIHHDLGNQADEALGWKILGNFHLRHRSIPDARMRYDGALERFPEQAARHRIDIAASLALCHLTDADPGSARDRLDAALAAAEAAGYLAGRAQILLNLALVTERLGDRATAIGYAMRAASETFGNPRVIAAAAAVARRMELTNALVEVVPA